MSETLQINVLFLDGVRELTWWNDGETNIGEVQYQAAVIVNEVGLFEDWMFANCPNSEHHYKMNFGPGSKAFIDFNNKTEAMLFKLAWGSGK